MSRLDIKQKRLTDADIDIAKIPNPAIRHKGGFWLQGELVTCFDAHIFSYEQRIEFMTIVKVLLDIIFRDAVDDTGDLSEFGFDGLAKSEALTAAQRGAIDAAEHES